MPEKRKNKSTASVGDRLRDHLAKLVTSIKAEMESTLHSGSPEAVALQRERFLMEVLSRFFPRTFDFAKGKIFDSFGNTSDSIDIVVLSSNHPKFRDSKGDIEIILADGVHLAMELKPDLTDLPPLERVRRQPPEIWRALEQMRTVKKLRRAKNEALVPNWNADFSLKDYATRVPSYLVTSKAPDTHILARYVFDYYVKHNVPTEEQLDYIFIIDKGFVWNIKHNSWKPQVAPLPIPSIAAFDTPNSMVELLAFMLLEMPCELQVTAPFLPTYLMPLMTRHVTHTFSVHGHHSVSPVDRPDRPTPRKRGAKK